ncbi:putative 60S ribosomal protein L2 [Sesbania bispinosa]|nr:putative 60S ribosomal protein L2 [Sesbania bispinosa]
MRQFTFGTAKTAGRITSFHRGGGCNEPSISNAIPLLPWALSKGSSTTLTVPLASPSFAGSTASTLPNAKPPPYPPPPLRQGSSHSILPPPPTFAACSPSIRCCLPSEQVTSESLCSPLGLPRIAVAAARPAFFAPRMKGEETLEVRNWRRNSNVWAHRNKRKAAISWHSIAR